MWFVRDGFGSFFKIAMLVLVIVTGMGLLATSPSSGEGYSLDCRDITDNARINDFICRLDPRIYMSRPVSDYLPFLAETEED